MMIARPRHRQGRLTLGQVWEDSDRHHGVKALTPLVGTAPHGEQAQGTLRASARVSVSERWGYRLGPRWSG